MTRFQDLKFKTKLSILTGTAVFGLVLFALLAFRTLAVVEVNGPVYQQVISAQNVVADVIPPSLNILTARLAIYKMADFADDPVQRNKWIDAYRQAQKEFREAQARYMTVMPQGELRDAMVRSYSAGQEYFALADREYLPAMERGDTSKAQELRRSTLGALAGRQAEAVDDVTRIAQELVKRSEAEAVATVSSRTKMLLGLAVGVIVALIIIGTLVIRGILAPVKQMVTVLGAVAAGDLSQEVAANSKDEIGAMGRSLSEAVSSMNAALRSITRSAEQIASATEEISSAASQAAEGAVRQKDQTTQVATAMEQMSSTVLQVSDNSNRASESARSALGMAANGGKVVEGSLAGMRSIATSVSNVAARIRQLGENSGRIGKIVNVIDEIADQTNLLALNAAIEAARAGEQGRGFAVVADEVRKLAERTTTATKEIGEMISSIQEGTQAAVQAMEVGSQEVKLGVEQTVQAGGTLREIIDTTGQVGDMITQIATAATEQSAAIEQVRGNVDQIAGIATESATGAEQTARACQDLANLALDLQQLVGKFRVSEEGTTAWT